MYMKDVVWRDPSHCVALGMDTLNYARLRVDWPPAKYNAAKWEVLEIYSRGLFVW